MKKSKIYFLIVILVGLGVTTFLLVYTGSFSSENNLLESDENLQPSNNLKLKVEEENSISQDKELSEVEIEKISNRIETKTKGNIISYQEKSFYSKDDFFLISKNKKGFKSKLIKKFKNEIVGVTALDCEVVLNESTKSALLRCDIRGANYGDNSYNMHFLLRGTKRFGFDLYGFEPKTSPYGKSLTFEGKIDGVPTKIIFKFPYELSHCHEHVWPK